MKLEWQPGFEREEEQLHVSKGCSINNNIFSLYCMSCLSFRYFLSICLMFEGSVRPEFSINKYSMSSFEKAMSAYKIAFKQLQNMEPLFISTIFMVSPDKRTESIFTVELIYKNSCFLLSKLKHVFQKGGLATSQKPILCTDLFCLS